MKKFLAILLVLALAVGCVVPMALAADATIAVSSATAKAGETVDVSIKLQNNPGIAVAYLNVSYDSSVMSISKVTVGSAYSAGTVVGGDTTANPYRICYDDSLASSNNTAEDFATVTFAVKEDAAAGDYTVAVSYDQAEVYDLDENDVAFTVENGTVTVEGTTPVTPDEPDQPTECEHTYVYADNGDGTHTGTCSKCSATVTEDHTNVNHADACVCGYQCTGSKTNSNTITAPVWMESDGEIEYVCRTCGKHVSNASVPGAPTTTAVTVVADDKTVALTVSDLNDMIQEGSLQYNDGYTVTEYVTVADILEAADVDVYGCDKITFAASDGFGYTSTVKDLTETNIYYYDSTTGEYTETPAVLGIKWSSDAATEPYYSGNIRDFVGIANTATSGRGNRLVSNVTTISVSRVDHTFGEPVETVIPATCTEAGEKLTTKTCTVCGYEEVVSEVIPATGHTYGDAAESVTKEASCAEAGEKTITKTCTACGYVQTTTEAIPATGHTAVTDAAVAATCKATGLTEGSHCSVCGTVIKAQEVVPMTAHTYGEAVETVTKEATCTEDGEKTITKTCTVCGDTVTTTEVIKATGHDFETVNAKEATTTEEGYTGENVCKNCGYTVKGEVIPVKTAEKTDDTQKTDTQKTDTKTQTTTTDPTTAKTGDHSGIVIAVCLALLAVSGTAIVVLKKKFN